MWHLLDIKNCRIVIIHVQVPLIGSVLSVLQYWVSLQFLSSVIIVFRAPLHPTSQAPPYYGVEYTLDP